MIDPDEEELFVILPDEFALDSPPSEIAPRRFSPSSPSRVSASQVSVARVSAGAVLTVPAAPSLISPSLELPPPPLPATVPAPPAAVPVKGSGTAFPLVLGVLVTALLFGVLAWGWSYYELPLEARPTHPKHEALRSSGTIGLTLAIAGTALMLLNLSYLLRKAFLWLQRMGSLRSWMAFHVLTGLAGPAMVLLHTGFLPTSALGTMSFASMLVVVTTGVIGRYIYSRVPRSLAGRELELEEVRRRLGEVHRQLAEFGVDARRLDGSGIAPPSRSIVAAVVSIATGDRGLRRQWRKYRQVVRSSPRISPHAREVLPLLRRVFREGQWLSRYHELRSLMGTWRFLHRWLAIVMLMLAGFHIYVAVRFGDLWVLS